MSQHKLSIVFEEKRPNLMKSQNTKTTLEVIGIYENLGILNVHVSVDMPIQSSLSILNIFSAVSVANTLGMQKYNKIMELFNQLVQCCQS